MVWGTAPSHGLPASHCRAMNGALHAMPEPQMWAAQGAAFDAVYAFGTYLSDAKHQQEAFALQDLPLFAAKTANHKAQPGLVCRYHLHSDIAWVLIFGCYHGLVSSKSSGLELEFRSRASAVEGVNRPAYEELVHAEKAAVQQGGAHVSPCVPLVKFSRFNAV